jgi:DNA modification methylase
MACSARTFCGDWLELAANLAPSTVDLLYVDPPFNTGVTQRSPVRGESQSRRTDDAYADSWPSTASYVDFVRERMRATLPALKPTANILLHCDWRASHYLRVMLDELLGEDHFVNHLIWSYGLGGSSPRTFARKHDDILFYCVDPKQYFFEPPMVPATSQRLKGQLKKATDVIDIPTLNNMAAERTGYPTQKPLALLTMLVQACSPKEGVVLDPCSGSGTTAVAALTSGRHAIAGDRSPKAIELIRQRIAQVPDAELHNLSASCALD